jgi:hypothetical protein
MQTAVWLHVRVQVCEAVWAMAHAGCLNLQAQGLQALHAPFYEVFAAIAARACLGPSRGIEGQYSGYMPLVTTIFHARCSLAHALTAVQISAVPHD